MVKLLSNLLLSISFGGGKIMSEKNIRPQSGSKTVAIDNRAQIAKIRFLLFMSILISAGLALVLTILVGH